MKRQVIRIEAERCNGCRLCVPNCPEGAIQVIDGKARLISDAFCDGLGACLGECPQGAITVETREAEPYDEKKVMENIIRQGPNVIAAHLKHIESHGEKEYLAEARAVLRSQGLRDPLESRGPVGARHGEEHHSGCPGSRAMNFTRPPAAGKEPAEAPSRLTHWPIQLHLISPDSVQYRDADVLLSADCVAYAVGGFHQKFLDGKSLAIACPKLDDGHEAYEQKLRALIERAGIRSLTVAVMEVPCCRGLVALTQRAAEGAARRVPITAVTVGIQGEILREERL